VQCPKCNTKLNRSASDEDDFECFCCGKVVYSQIILGGEKWIAKLVAEASAKRRRTNIAQSNNFSKIKEQMRGTDA
jgi:transcription initiation factor TFIIIB Brf1 subunit/transcription initiation factor TFIIB